MLMEPMLMASQAPSAATLTGESLAAMQPSLLNPATGSSYFGMEGQTPFFTEQLKAATALPGESGGGMMQGGGTSSMFGSGQGVMPQGLSTSPTPSSDRLPEQAREVRPTTLEHLEPLHDLGLRHRRLRRHPLRGWRLLLLLAAHHL
jgi:hypothetical protein